MKRQVSRLISKKQENFGIKLLLLAISLLLLAYLIVSQRSTISESIDAIEDANIPLIGWSVVFMASSYITATGVYIFLSIKKISFGKTLWIQTASNFTNKFLPAGAGGAATYVKYLNKNGHTNSEALSIVGVNNLLGFIGLMLVMFFVALLSRTPLSEVFVFHVSHLAIYIISAGLITIGILGVILPRTRRFIARSLQNLTRDTLRVASNPQKLCLALCSSIGITLFYGLALHATILAFNQHTTIIQTFAVLTIGVAASTVTPTPGGIGGAEAGYVAALASVGIPTSAGLSIALTYRLITFWLPVVPGFFAFQYAIKQKYL